MVLQRGGSQGCWMVKSWRSEMSSNPNDSKLSTEVSVAVDLVQYPLPILQRASHRFTATHFVEISIAGNEALVRFKPKEIPFRFPQLADEFRNALLDDALRAQIAAETQEVREIIVGAALKGALHGKSVKKFGGESE